MPTIREKQSPSHGLTFRPPEPARIPSDGIGTYIPCGLCPHMVPGHLRLPDGVPPLPHPQQTGTRLIRRIRPHLLRRGAPDGHGPRQILDLHLRSRFGQRLPQKRWLSERLPHDTGGGCILSGCPQPPHDPLGGTARTALRPVHHLLHPAQTGGLVHRGQRRSDRRRRTGDGARPGRPIPQHHRNLYGRLLHKRRQRPPERRRTEKRPHPARS